MKILVLASDNPSPPINGTRIRNFYLWEELRAMGHEVKVLAITRNPADLKLSNDEIEFFLFSRKSLLKRLRMRLFHSYHEWPVSDDLHARVAVLTKEWRPQVIHAEELRMGAYLPEDAPLKLSLCLHNVESELIKKTKAAPFTFAASLFNKIYQWNLRRFERKNFKKAQVIMTYSERDRETYAALYPEFSYKVTSNGVNLVRLTPAEEILPDPKKLLFLGSLCYLPNIEGLFWFLDHVRPLLKVPIDLTVAGYAPAQLVRDRLAQEKIPLLDTPLDLRPVYTEASALIVPILSGSGTRGKILEAMMYQRAVITTTKGIEGLTLEEGIGNLRGDSPEEFAAAIERWMKLSSEEQLALARSGHEAVITGYTWKSVGENLLKLWKET